MHARGDLFQNSTPPAFVDAASRASRPLPRAMASQPSPDPSTFFSMRIVSIDYYISPPVPDLDFSFSPFRGTPSLSPPALFWVLGLRFWCFVLLCCCCWWWCWRRAKSGQGASDQDLWLRPLWAEDLHAPPPGTTNSASFLAIFFRNWYFFWKRKMGSWFGFLFGLCRLCLICMCHARMPILKASMSVSAC